MMKAEGANSSLGEKVEEVSRLREELKAAVETKDEVELCAAMQVPATPLRNRMRAQSAKSDAGCAKSNAPQRALSVPFQCFV
eukprot:1968429-Rhodomonas_salina.1